jgi:SET and MYND domain-containing protein
MVHLETKETNPANLLEEKLDQCCSLNEAKKKKKSKKKTSASSSPATPLAPFYQQSLALYPVKLNNTKAKGRHAIAAQNLEEGFTLCQEQATAFVVRSEFLEQQCHVCLSDLKQKMMCSDCRKSFYCSKECLEKDNELHMLVCGPFAQIDAIGRATDVDADLLRLMTLLMARKYLDTQQPDVKEESIGINPTSYWCVEDLISHRSSADPSFINVVNDACKYYIYISIANKPPHLLTFFVHYFSSKIAYGNARIYSYTH